MLLSGTRLLIQNTSRIGKNTAMSGFYSGKVKTESRLNPDADTNPL